MCILLCSTAYYGALILYCMLYRLGRSTGMATGPCTGTGTGAGMRTGAGMGTGAILVREPVPALVQNWPLGVLVQACLRAPHVVADFFFFFLRLLLFTHFGESPVRENLFPPIFWHN